MFLTHTLEGVLADLTTAVKGVLQLIDIVLELRLKLLDFREELLDLGCQTLVNR